MLHEAVGAGLHLGGLRALGGDAQADRPAAREEGEARAAIEPRREVAHLIGEGALAHAGREERPVADHEVGRGGAQTRQQALLDQVAHLGGHAGHGHEALAAAFKVKPGRGALVVVEHLEALRHLRLHAVALGHGPPAPRKPVLDALHGRRVLDERDVEEGGEGLAREVVVRGPEAAGDDDEVGRLPRAAEFVHDVGDAVGHGDAPAQRDPFEAEPLAEPRSIRVDDLPDEDLVADGNQGGNHGDVRRAMDDRRRRRGGA